MKMPLIIINKKDLNKINKKIESKYKRRNNDNNE